MAQTVLNQITKMGKKEYNTFFAPSFFIRKLKTPNEFLYL